MWCPGNKELSQGICRAESSPMSYTVKVGEQEYRSNRRHLMLTKEPQDIVPHMSLEPTAIIRADAATEMEATPPEVVAPNLATLQLRQDDRDHLSVQAQEAPQQHQPRHQSSSFVRDFHSHREWHA